MDYVFVKLCQLRDVVDGVQPNGPIMLVERCLSANEGPRPSRGKVRCLLHGTIWEGNTNDPNQEMKLKEELVFWSVIVLEGRAPMGELKILLGTRLSHLCHVFNCAYMASELAYLRVTF